MSRSRRMRGKRAFTLLEMMIVMVVATVLTTMGLVGIASVIREARYRADRARLYMDLREMRDQAKHGMRFLTVREVPGTPAVDTTKVEFKIGTACSLGPSVIIDYPAIDFAGDHMLCIMDNGVSATDFLEFIPMNPSGAPPADQLLAKKDGSLVDSWNEFPDEGCLDANPSGDPDGAAPCGD